MNLILKKLSLTLTFGFVASTGWASGAGKPLAQDEFDRLIRREFACDTNLWGGVVDAGLKIQSTTFTDGSVHYSVADLKVPVFSYGGPELTPTTVRTFTDKQLEVVDSQSGYMTSQLVIDFDTGNGLARNKGAYGGWPLHEPRTRFDDRRELLNCRWTK